MPVKVAGGKNIPLLDLDVFIGHGGDLQQVENVRILADKPFPGDLALGFQGQLLVLGRLDIRRVFAIRLNGVRLDGRVQQVIGGVIIPLGNGG